MGNVELMFCKRCRCNLMAIESRSCPECGRAFDSANPKTYRKHVGLPKWVRRMGQGLVVLLVIVLGVIEWRYQREAGAAEQLNGTVEWSDDAHQWVAWIPFLHERLQHVVSLILANSQLATLPPEVGKLTKLEELYLEGNQLTNLPPEIGKLSKLEGLDLDHNQLATLPREIGKLTELKVLRLDGNQLTKLPPEIGKLAKLEYLILSGNLFTTLPAELGELTKLVQLGLDSNPITDAGLVPLKTLDNLLWLDLNGTKVTAQGVAALKQALPKCEITSDID